MKFFFIWFISTIIGFVFGMAQEVNIYYFKEQKKWQKIVAEIIMNTIISLLIFVALLFITEKI